MNVVTKASSKPIAKHKGKKPKRLEPAINGETAHRLRVEQAIADFRKGKMVILVDDEDRENEGDLCLPAEKVSPQAVNFMATHGRGLICLALSEGKIQSLRLPMMVADNTSPLRTAFTVSIEAKHGVTTGISAKDRATTIRTAVKDGARPEDLVSPGHVFPLRARDGGVLVRTGQTEGSVDLAQLAGLKRAAVICEIMNRDGTMARMPELNRFARRHKLTLLSVADLVRYRVEREQHLRAVAQSRTSVEGLGEFKVVAFKADVDNRTHLAFVRGELVPGEPTLVRMHSGCPLGDVFRSERCDCGRQLRQALERIAAEGRGAVVYLQKEVRDPAALTRCTHLPEVERGRGRQGKGGPPDLREFGVGAQILRELGVTKLKLLTNHPRKIVGLEGFGLEVVERVPLQVQPATQSRSQLLEIGKRR
jgi:3,4-dihydroxy 2-butanone 4-phosphate synthase / GTP cyclohydrolase II